MTLSGSDLFCEGLTYAQERTPNATLIQMDARRIPFRDEFDVIGDFDVREHVEEDDVVFGQMFRATKRGGGIMVTVPQHRFLWSAADVFGHHRRRYTGKELVKKV